MLDDMYQGVYNGRECHAPDVDAVLRRAHAHHVSHVIVTAGTVQETTDALAFCAARAGQPDLPALYSTAGVHPTRCRDLDAAGVAALAETVAAHGRHVGGRIVALGECGIDHDRLHFCPAAAQAAGFEVQLRGLAGPGAGALPLPLFLHYRGDSSSAAGTVFFDVLQRTRGLWGARGGVVHSFTGTADDVARIVELGLAFSVNGVSFRTAESIAASTLIPAERLLLETDAPWCDIRPTHPSFPLLQAARARLLAREGDDNSDLAPIPTCRRDRFRDGCAVKGRNEPATIADVLLVAAEARHADPTLLAQQAYNNTISMFFS